MWAGYRSTLHPVCDRQAPGAAWSGCRTSGSVPIPGGRPFDISNLNFCGRPLGIIGPPHDARDDQGREDRENRHHDHDLDERKSTLTAEKKA